MKTWDERKCWDEKVLQNNAYLAAWPLWKRLQIERCVFCDETWIKIWLFLVGADYISDRGSSFNLLSPTLLLIIFLKSLKGRALVFLVWAPKGSKHMKIIVHPFSHKILINLRLTSNQKAKIAFLLPPVWLTKSQWMQKTSNQKLYESTQVLLKSHPNKKQKNSYFHFDCFLRLFVRMFTQK